jgi:hypothetical protein
MIPGLGTLLKFLKAVVMEDHNIRVPVLAQKWGFSEGKLFKEKYLYIEYVFEILLNICFHTASNQSNQSKGKKL